MNKNEIVEMLKGLTDKEREALTAAMTVIYLGDSSDYINGLWEVVTAIIGDKLDEDGVNIKEILNILKPEFAN